MTNPVLTTSHSVRLTKLVPGKAYVFYVSSADVAGNAGTNSNSGAYFTFVGVATPTVLLVDAYEPVNGSPEIPDGTYTNALTSAGFSFAHWKVSERGSPQLSDLQAFPVVFWRLVDDIINYGVDADGFADPSATNNTLTAQQQFMITSYLDHGGSFLMTSMGILSQLGNVSFRKNVLQVAGFKQNPDPPSPCTDCDEYFGVPAILGESGDSISSGVNLTLDYINYPTLDLFDVVYGPDFSDTFTPASKATPILFESVSGKPCGMSYPRIGTDSPGRAVFLSFPIDAVPATGTPPNNEAVLLRNILKFLAPGANGVGSIYLNNNVYSIPDQVTVEVGDADLAGAGSAQVIASTSSSTNHVLVTTSETTHPGLFRGLFTLVATNAAANQLAVRNGDTITVGYFDASLNSNLVVNATVDTVPPVISQVAAVTGFGDATVSWKTSKPADSLVQYGESVLLGRTAYSGTLVTNHSITVSRLLPNHNYNYKVVSRDDADNTTVDDNQGNLFTFTTRRAPQPPWSDDLENGPGDWTVVPDVVQGTDLNWSLGTPKNGLQTSAHSGTNAWGSNLRGESFNLFESTFLYSPMIDLSGLSAATLTFWHCCDFSSMFTSGQLGISTSSSIPPASIPTLTNFSGQLVLDWEQVSVNLTPFVGQTIQVVWYYQGIDVGLSAPPDGWLVDNVSITGLAGGGTIVVTKNLGQGTFTLNGIISRTGTAPSTTITNAPPGPYTVQFSDVAFYQTPPGQSNTLAKGGTLTFTGNYDFIDANQNGISDAWEKYYFGAAPTNRTQFTDTDGDGMSDYAEFIAGTNPTNAASKFVFLSAKAQTNQLVQLQWAAIPGRLYQVEAATILPLQTAPAKLSGSINRISGSFKLHIDAQTNSPYAIQVSSNLTAWTSLYTNLPGGKLDYVDAQPAHATRRFYRTLALTTQGTTNLASWAPISDWLQASGSPMTYTTTNANRTSRFYRVQVRP